MGDYGLLQKGPFMYDNLIKVPLLFWGKGVEKSVTGIQGTAVMSVNRKRSPIWYSRRKLKKYFTKNR